MIMPDYGNDFGIDRRTFLAGFAAGSTLRAGQDVWTDLPAILKRIQAPTFPDRVFDPARYGAAGDGKTDCTEAFGRAIAECSKAGGGRVSLGQGDFVSAAIVLPSNVNLHVPAGATIRFVQDPQRYLPAVYTRWEGTECMNYSPFIYAYGEENIAVTGAGMLDGQCDSEHWWPWKGKKEYGWKKGDPDQAAARERLMDMAEHDAPVKERLFGDGAYLRPQFIQPYLCNNVLIEGVTITNSPMYEVHPVLCHNVTVRNVKISSLGPNNDGCDPESCEDVLIEGCEFTTGDDCIAIKSGRNRDGRQIATPSKNIVIRRCLMKDGHGGVTIGSEISGDVHNVYAEECRMDSPRLERVLRIKTNSVRGGVIDHIYMRNVQAGQVSGAAVDIDFRYEEGDRGKFKPLVRDIEVRDLACGKSQRALSLYGYPNAPIQDVRLVNCTFDKAQKANSVENVKGLSLSGVRINGKPV
jgi:polygalacturonase